MLKRGGYGKDFHHRLGFIETLPKKKNGITRIWVQAVSLGEMKAIEPLIAKLSQHPNLELVISATTSTAYKMVSENYSNKILKTCAFPFDSWCTSRSAWNRINPDLMLLMEGDLWPEHIHQAKSRNVPLILINGRLSDKSFKRYSKVKWLANQLIFKKISLLLTGSQQDHKRFLSLGMTTTKCHSTGNLKFDVSPKNILTALEKENLKQELGFDKEDLVLMGASTWPGEEEMLIRVYQKALLQGINCKLLIVPRHPERKSEIEPILNHQKHPWHFRSICKKAPKGTGIYIGDTTGELLTLLQVANLAFIGKSLLPNEGGQTPIEAAALGIPIVYGPRMSNFRQICQSLERVQAALPCKNAEETEKKLLELLKNPDNRNRMSSAEKAWHLSNQGATDKTIDFIAPYFNPTTGSNRK